MPTSPAPITTAFLIFLASSFISIASSKSLSVYTLLASLKFLIGGIEA